MRLVKTCMHLHPNYQRRRSTKPTNLTWPHGNMTPDSKIMISCVSRPKLAEETEAYQRIIMNKWKWNDRKMKWTLCVRANLKHSNFSLFVTRQCFVKSDKREHFLLSFKQCQQSLTIITWWKSIASNALPAATQSTLWLHLSWHQLKMHWKQNNMAGHDHGHEPFLRCGTLPCHRPHDIPTWRIMISTCCCSMLQLRNNMTDHPHCQNQHVGRNLGFVNASGCSPSTDSVVIGSSETKKRPLHPGQVWGVNQETLSQCAISDEEQQATMELYL